MASKVPASLKSVGSYVKVANDNASRDPVVYYWSLFHSVQLAMKIDSKSPEARQFISGLLATLETIKKQLHSNEAITSEIVAQAHIENYALKLFKYADDREKTGNVDKAVVHAFYTAGLLMDVLSVFGPVDEMMVGNRKYAKWKSMQINQCLTTGTPYIPSTAQAEDPSASHELDIPQPPVPQSFYPQEPQAPYPPIQPAGEKFEFKTDPHVENELFGDEGNNASSYPPPASPRSTIPQRPPPASAPSAPIPTAYNHPPVEQNHAIPTAASSSKQLTPEDFKLAMKFTKYALSALDYEDTKSAIENLKKALNLIE